MKLSEHFTLQEMMRSQIAARAGIDNTPPQVCIAASRELAERVLEPIRAHYNVPITISSWYRGDALNKRTPGSSPTSQHCKGEAVDFEIAGVANIDLAHWIAQSNVPFDQLILEYYSERDPHAGWVHVSHRVGRNRRVILTAMRVKGKTQYLPGLPQ